MADEKKTTRKNPHPLVVKGIFFVTACFEDKQYVVSNGLSFIRFCKDGEDIKKGDYVEIHGPVYQRKDAANPIITGEAIVKKLTEKEVDDYKAAQTKMFEAKKETKPEAKKAAAKKPAPKKADKPDEHKMPWE